jgi:hypothetical protein
MAMRHRATVLRNVETSTGRWNTPVAPDYQPLEDPIACWFWSAGTAGTRTVEGPAVNVVLEDLRMLVPLGADLSTADRIGDVVDRRGRIISTGELRIDADQVVANSHRELVLARITGSVTTPAGS